jgi:hypothetical protein
MTIGYLYCFSNRSMPHILKIGVTTREPLIRLKEANSSDTWKPPTPYEMEFAKRVISPNEKETMLHTILAKYTERINPNREFFRASVEEVKNLFDLIDGEYYNLERENKSESLTENEQEYLIFIEWLNSSCIEHEESKVSLRQLSEKSGISECKIKYFMKKKGYKYYNFRFPTNIDGSYDQGGFKNIEMLYFTEKINL